MDVNWLVQEFAEVFNPPLFFDILRQSKKSIIFQTDMMISFAPGTIDPIDCRIEYSMVFDWA